MYIGVFCGVQNDPTQRNHSGFTTLKLLNKKLYAVKKPQTIHLENEQKT